MRVTNGMMSNRVARNLTTTQTNLNTLGTQVYTGMKAQKSSEDPAAAMKAYKIRRDLTRNTQIQDSVKFLSGQFTQTETAVTGIKDLIASAQETIIQGKNGTLSTSDREVMAKIFENYQSEIFQLGNSNYAGKYILGGPNTTTPPFTLDENGNILYNGQDLSSNTIDAENIYTTLGQRIEFDEGGNLDTASAVSMSTPGCNVMGYGVDENGNSNNVYILFGEIAEALRNGDTQKLEQQTAKLDDMLDNALVNIADVGERQKYVEFIETRAIDDEFNLKSKQNDVEGIDQSEAIIDYKVMEMAYNAALSMGSKVLQSSLLDYIK